MQQSRCNGDTVACRLIFPTQAPRARLIDHRRQALRFRDEAPTMQGLFAHHDVPITMIDTRVLSRGGKGVKSSVESL